MKTIVVYYSYTGTTKKYVEKIKDRINCDLLEIKPKQDIKVKGFTSYIVGGVKSMKKQTPELVEYSFNQDDYDFIIIASPVWAFTYAPAMRTFLQHENIENKIVSYFMTHRGGPKEAHLHFTEALSKNMLKSGLDINEKDSEEQNLAKIDKWIGEINENWLQKLDAWWYCERL